MTRRMEKEERRLEEHGVRPTAVRNMLLAALSARRAPVSAVELEVELDTVDRSTISRSLTLFVEKGLLHIVNDGTGIPKYECCPSHLRHAPDDSHPHFHCRRCGATICLSDIPEAVPRLPSGFVAESVATVVTGICPRCADT